MPGDAFGFVNSSGAHFDNFSRNQIRLIYGGSATIGGAGGTGGAGGDGGMGGAGFDIYNGGRGGGGGDGGPGRLAGDGALSGMAVGMWVSNTGVNSGNITNSIIAQVFASRGGTGGTGGSGGAGGDGGAGGPGGGSGGGTGAEGPGGDGGDAADGGDGRDSQKANLLFLQNTNAVVTNNTFFAPHADPLGGAAGAAGSPGLGGAGGTPGIAGASASDGAAGLAGSSYGLETSSSGTFYVYNNLFSAADEANSTGLTQGSGTIITGDYNNLWRWGTAYSGVSASAHDLAVDPLLEDPFNGGYELQSGSPCIDVGDNSAPGLPTSDYEGKSRIIDGDKNGSAVVDMGAYEFYAEFLIYMPMMIR
jgi:hypothetical protein